VIYPVSCAVPHPASGAPKLSGEGTVRLVEGSKLRAICQQGEMHGEFFCNYEVNPDFEARFVAAGLRISARGPAGEIRAVELPGRRFFHATLFQPQLSSKPRNAHPILVAFLKASASFQKSRSGASKAAGK
jgi:CTP synthase (UTP-ammonia lyase)